MLRNLDSVISTLHIHEGRTGNGSQKQSWPLIIKINKKCWVVCHKKECIIAGVLYCTLYRIGNTGHCTTDSRVYVNQVHTQQQHNTKYPRSISETDSAVL